MIIVFVPALRRNSKVGRDFLIRKSSRMSSPMTGTFKSRRKRIFLPRRFFSSAIFLNRFFKSGEVVCIFYNFTEGQRVQRLPAYQKPVNASVSQNSHGIFGIERAAIQHGQSESLFFSKDFCSGFFYVNCHFVDESGG